MTGPPAETRELTSEQWAVAGERLRKCREAYASVGTAGMFALNYVLMPLSHRFEQGERTEKLYQEIMDVKL